MEVFTINLVISDIHGNFDALSAVLNDAINRYRRFHKVIVLGDTVDYGADSLKVITRLRTFVEDSSNCDSFYCVRGNHEEALNQGKSDFRTKHAKVNFKLTRKELKSLEGKDLEFYEKLSKAPLRLNLEDQSYVTACHGYLDNYLKGSPPDSKLKMPTEFDYIQRPRLATEVVLGGHSHIQGFEYITCVFTGFCDVLYVNPGSVGQPRNGDPRAQYLVTDDQFTQFYFRRVSYDVESAADRIVTSGRPKFLATRLFLGI